MAADRSITCVNQDGDSITFTERALNPFILVSAEGVYDAQNNMNLTENTVTDGAVYQGSVAKYRNIVLTVKDQSITRSKSINDDIYINAAVIRNKTLEILDARTPEASSGGKDFVDHRALLDKVFKRNELGRLTFKEDDEERVIDYYVESVTSTGTHTSRLHTISLICPDPFFYDPYDQILYLSRIVADFEFIHEFIEDGEEFGHSLGAYENIYNETANENIGLTIKISGDVEIVNPVITHMERNEYIQIGKPTKTFRLGVGEQLIISTGIGNKHVYWIHDRQTEEINYYMLDGSTFIQLMRGNNHISFDALAGRVGLSIEIVYRLQYARA